MQNIIPTTTKETKEKKPAYRKPESVKKLEAAHTLWKYEGRNIPFKVPTKLRDDEANGLTKCLKCWSEINGAFFQRNNSTGIYDKRLGCWKRSGTTKGIADVQITYKGKTLNYEIKIGRDKQSPDQKKVEADILRAGGHYVVVKSFDDFLNDIEPLLHIP